MTTKSPESSRLPHGRERSWREIIDGWVRSAEIRRDIKFVIVLVCSCILVGLAVITSSEQAPALLRWLTSTVEGKIVGGGAIATIVGGSLVRRLRRNRAHLDRELNEGRPAELNGDQGQPDGGDEGDTRAPTAEGDEP